MPFRRITELANATPTRVLCDTWGTTPERVAEVQRAECCMTIREAGDLAEIHGMELLDVLTL